MDDSDYRIFVQLFREVYKKCFQAELMAPMSETATKTLQSQIHEATGLTIGWRSLKNYAQELTVSPAKREENPSVATLDTLARYVLNAPPTDEISRKNTEQHHPYWYRYTRETAKTATVVSKTSSGDPVTRPRIGKIILPGLLLLAAITIVIFFYYKKRDQPPFADHFDHLDENSISQNGWTVVGKDQLYWEKRGTRPGGLTLYTLAGDDWPDSTSPPSIKNLMIRSAPSGCFTVELQMQEFIPAAEWQQAGILLLADSNLSSGSIRMSLGYNDFFGGSLRSPEVIIQGIESQLNGRNPEEFIHSKVLDPDSASKNVILYGNLRYSSLRIEKQGKVYRFLFAGGLTGNVPFKELAFRQSSFVPRYIGIFALKGWKEGSPISPVLVRKFALTPTGCQ